MLALTSFSGKRTQFLVEQCLITFGIHGGVQTKRNNKTQNTTNKKNHFGAN